MVFPSDQLLMNNQKQTLEIIEVQTGEKLSEKDIIRYQDIYGRLKKDKKWNIENLLVLI